MITILFIISVVLNALMLIGLLYTIKLNLKSEQENPTLEKVLDSLVLGIFIGIVITLILTAIIIL